MHHISNSFMRRCLAHSSQAKQNFVFVRALSIRRESEPSTLTGSSRNLKQKRPIYTEAYSLGSAINATPNLCLASHLQEIGRRWFRMVFFGSMRLQSGTRVVALVIIRLSIILFGNTMCVGQSSPPPDEPTPKAAHNSRQSTSRDPSSKQSTPLDPLDGSTTANVYTNRFFRFSLTVPEGWKVVPNLRARTGSPQNGKQPAGRGGQPQPSNGITEESSIPLLLLVENLAGKPPLQWRRLVVMANKLKDPNVSIEDHLKYGAQLLLKNHSPAQMVGDPQPVVIGGRQFWKQEITQAENGLTYRLAMLATKSKDYSLQFILWTTDANGTTGLEPLLDSLQFF